MDRDKKNALAISSSQSNKIESYKQVELNYQKSLDNDKLTDCPDYWGGFSFIPYYFEFWQGHQSRLNKILKYMNCKIINGKTFFWSHNICVIHLLV